SSTRSSSAPATSATRWSTRATRLCGGSSRPDRPNPRSVSGMTSMFEDVAAVMRAQTPGRRLKSDPVDDETVLSLIELSEHAIADPRRRCESVVARHPEVRHHLPRTSRQSWSVYKRSLRTQSHDDAALEARQWESDHFEDVPVHVVACIIGRRPVFR